MDEIRKMKRIFFIGIGGVGMSALAVILKERGFDVSGSDRGDSATTRSLAKRGIQVWIGHDASNLGTDLDAVVFTNAVTEDNPELSAARARGIRVFERAAMLDIIAKPRYTVGVSGTHGKTTTTSMVARIFLAAGLDPSLAIGGYIREISGSGYEGKGKFFVYEACEAFESFLKLHPDLALLTNIDADHLDYYGTFDAIKAAFAKYVSENVPAHGLVVYNRDDLPLREVIDAARPSRSISVGIDTPECDFRAVDIQLFGYATSFRVLYKGKPVGEFMLNVPGRHNVTNSLLAIAAAKLNGVPMETVQKTLAQFRNADRRFQLKLEREDLTVIDDYAHHPSEIDATLSAAKNLSEKKHARLIAVFQPHLYSRTEFLYKDFAKSLCRADGVVLTEIYAAREKNVHNISSRIIFDEVVRMKGSENVVFSSELRDVPEKVKTLLCGNSIIVTLGAGDVWKVSDMFGIGN
jgi:UDP-N-acetylmuramate--alanine ligase